MADRSHARPRFTWKKNSEATGTIKYGDLPELEPNIMGSVQYL